MSTVHTVRTPRVYWLTANFVLICHMALAFFAILNDTAKFWTPATLPTVGNCTVGTPYKPPPFAHHTQALHEAERCAGRRRSNRHTFLDVWRMKTCFCFTLGQQAP